MLRHVMTALFPHHPEPLTRLLVISNTGFSTIHPLEKEEQ
jgi:hypothetical protein